MQDKYLNYIQELRLTLSKIELLIEDNNQNIKDCLLIINDLNKAMNFKTPSKLKKLVFKIFRIKCKNM